ncbi:MAG: GAF domain-containing protein [Candidatus Brocadiae bacterium]|nr:GAF domain-containing protein [Candidatus Brocadiia bacterium]
MDHDLANRYTRVALSISNALTPDSTLNARMTTVADQIWEEFGNGRPVSWVGFYLLGTGEMTLGPRRNKPACSPIGLHGACGTCATSGKTLIIRDVKDLGDNYIACDPRDRSEIVLPVRNRAGQILGVLDLDSHQVGAFSELDQRALEEIIRDHLDGA